MVYPVSKHRALLGVFYALLRLVSFVPIDVLVIGRLISHISSITQHVSSKLVRFSDSFALGSKWVVEPDNHLACCGWERRGARSPEKFFTFDAIR